MQANNINYMKIYKGYRVFPGHVAIIEYQILNFPIGYFNSVCSGQKRRTAGRLVRLEWYAIYDRL